MKRTIGIGLLIILNIVFVFVISKGSILSFGLIVAPLGQDGLLKIAHQTTIDILFRLAFISTVVLILNYILTKKMIVNKRPFLISIAITTIGVIVFVPFFLSARLSFIEYQKRKVMLQNYLDSQTITEAQIITHADTFQVEKLDAFIGDIGMAKYVGGPWKFAKKFKIVFKRINNTGDSLFTNGIFYGDYKGRYFSTDHNVIDKYLVK